MKILKEQALASKQYISIIRLFNHCDIATGDDFNLSRVKKQFQAEFSIGQDGFIVVDGYTYNRHDTFEEIEHPDFLKRLVYHKMIWEHPQILQLLEKNTADFSTIYDEFKPFWSNDDFDNFFSPYFAGPFNYLSRTLLAEKKLKEAGELLGYEGFLQPAEQEEAFRPIRLFLEENIRLLRNVKGDNYKLMRPKISHWIDTDWSLFLNNLPHEFYEEKTDIATLLVNIGVSVQKTHRRDCRKMSDQLVSLRDSPEGLSNTIISNHNIYNRSSGNVSWRGLWWVAWIIFMIIRAVSSDGCNSNNSYRNNYYPTRIEYKSYDSLLKKLRTDTFPRIVRDSLIGR